jgi:hypothetical protein
MNYTQGLSEEQLQRYVPSAFAVTPYREQSSRYAFIPTSAVIEGMRGAGLLPVQAIQSRTRVADKRDFTKHMIRFRPTGSLGQAAIVGDSVIEAVLINSHDGTSAYKLMCGVFRFVCSNGMVVADSMLESIHIRHTGNVIEDVIQGSERILAAAPKVMDTIGQWKTITLSTPEQHLLAETAHSLRFPKDEETGESSAKVTPDMLLSARRHDDNGTDLWRTFNRIQENTTKRTVGYVNRRRVSSRAVKGIDGDVRLNRELWAMAERFAELKGGA